MCELCHLVLRSCLIKTYYTLYMSRCVFVVAASTAITDVPVAALTPVYQEVWFIAIMAILALILLFIVLAVCVRASGASLPYIRERLPLQPRQQKTAPPKAYCIPYDASIITTVSTRHFTQMCNSSCSRYMHITYTWDFSNSRCMCCPDPKPPCPLSSMSYLTHPHNLSLSHHALSPPCPISPTHITCP